MNETIFISKCCKVEVPEADEENNGVLWLCPKCKNECEVEEVCAYCLGTKEEVYDEDDGEGHMQRGVGSRPCPHCRPEPSYEHEDD